MELNTQQDWQRAVVLLRDDVTAAHQRAEYMDHQINISRRCRWTSSYLQAVGEHWYQSVSDFRNIICDWKGAETTSEQVSRWTHVWRRVQAVGVDHHRRRVGLRREDTAQTSQEKHSSVRRAANHRHHWHFSPADTTDQLGIKQEAGGFEQRLVRTYVHGGISHCRRCNAEAWSLNRSNQVLQDGDSAPSLLLLLLLLLALNSVPGSLAHSLSACLARSIARSLSFCPGGARWALKSHVGEVWHFSHCFYL